ncbi:DHH family phosphoesterase [Enterococcus hermanniensis]|uniref:Phosphoesterase RecJ protein n=1 Tax=Enterococcus hermanniensis TaxID=249189 RepID=A0A1L8TN76_9ENTE|nr:bifunctional oligoribonuclease/PAP phosphatase NrnA [Enterococcus hermanniensis]OJG45544.1 phosphoesterase RecJ protein [Enterococcus hermanniensis]
MTITEKIIEMIKQYDRIIIHRHMRPDPDALGSQCGLAEILRATYPKKEIYQVGGPVEGLEFLAEMDEITDDLYIGALVIVTDTANAPRISDDRYQLGDKLIKIDHHPNDDPYGDLLWVNTEASSCSEIIADLAFAEDLTLSENAARLLYGGIVGDTGRFLYPATTSHTLVVASKLLDYGFDSSKLNRQIDQISLEVAQLSGYLYQNLQIDDNGAGYVILDQAILNKYGIKDSDTASLVPLPGTIDTVLAWAVFVEQPEGYYRVRLRSKGPVINELAKQYHGGGHPLASGANAKDQAMCQEIYQKIQVLCAEYQVNN